jgi:SAM-dependent methyltransferase
LPNHWVDPKCAKAFWAQRELPPYRQLLGDTLEWAAPAAAESWLDLGCGGGAITRAIWDAADGNVNRIVGLDVAPANADAYAKLRTELNPASGDRVSFIAHDFSDGLSLFSDGEFDGVVSGLAISYAQSFDESTGQWTTTAYDRILAEVFRVLRPGGRFVFSVNVPQPSWIRIAWQSLAVVRHVPRPLHFLKRSWRMLRYGRWLKRSSRIGRFHYLPADVIAQKLAAAGFVEIEHRLSYSGQAFVFRCFKPR